jgi:hypothetical protein
MGLDEPWSLDHDVVVEGQLPLPRQQGQQLQGDEVVVVVVEVVVAIPRKWRGSQEAEE